MHIIRTNNNIEELDDCVRIKKVLLDYGFEATLAECEILWKMHSESFAAGWLILPEEDDALFNSISYYLIEDQDEKI